MITHIFHSTIVSGPETLALPALSRLGEPVTIVFLDEQRVPGGASGPVAYARGLGLEAHTVPVRSRWDREAFKSLGETLQRLGTTIGHAHDVKASLYLVQAARSMRRRGIAVPKLASTHHGAAARSGLIRVYEEIYVRWALPKFDHVFAVCRGDFESLKRRGVPTERMSIHYNGVDRVHVPAADRARAQAEIRARWRAIDQGLRADAIYLGAVARLSSEKRHDRMIRALRTARDRMGGRDFQLICFGTGAEEARLKALTAELGMADQVRWLGYSKTIGQEMAGFDLLLCLSDGEGIPINLIEAGWSGTPVLSTSVGGIPDLLDSSDVGYLVAKSDSDESIGAELARVMLDEPGRAATGQRYQERVLAQFSERSWLEQLKAAYNYVR